MQILLDASSLPGIFLEPAASNEARVPGAGDASVEPETSDLRNPCRKALRGRPKMQTSPQSACNPLPAASETATPSRRSEDLIYQAVTIAAILMLLGSIWVFLG